MRITVPSSALPILLWASILAAGQQFLDKPGIWKFDVISSDSRSLALKPAEKQLTTAKVRSALAFIRSNKLLNPPMGFEVHGDGANIIYPSDCEDAPCPKRPLRSYLKLLFYPYVPDAAGKPVTDHEYFVEIFISLNALDVSMANDYSMSYEGKSDEPGRHIVFEPEQVGTAQGFPLYDYHLLVVTRQPGPYWIPVTREEFLKVLIRGTETEAGKVDKAMAEMAARDPLKEWLSGETERRRDLQRAAADLRKVNPAQADEVLKRHDETERQMVEILKKQAANKQPIPENLMRLRATALHAELDALTSAQRKEDAWYGHADALTSGLAPAGRQGARRLVRINEDLLDQTRPRTATQMISARMDWNLPWGLDRVPAMTPDQNLAIARLWEFVQTFDWKGMLESLQP